MASVGKLRSTHGTTLVGKYIKYREQGEVDRVYLVTEVGDHGILVMEVIGDHPGHHFAFEDAKEDVWVVTNQEHYKEYYGFVEPID